MTVRIHALGALLLPLTLAGCSAAQSSTSAPTVTVTVAAASPTFKAGDAGPWDLHALCAAESEVATLTIWRRQQSAAGRLTSAQSEAVLQAIAVQYLEFDGRALPADLQQAVDTLRGAAGALEHPQIDLASASVRTADEHIHRACAEQGLTIGVLAQGG